MPTGTDQARRNEAPTVRPDWAQAHGIRARPWHLPGRAVRDHLGGFSRELRGVVREEPARRRFPGRCGGGNFLTRETRRGAAENPEMAGATGLEPAASGVTGRRSNQLSYA